MAAALIKSSRSLLTLGLVFLAMAAVLALIWWLIAFSPIGIKKVFEVHIDGDALRTTFNNTFVILISTTVVGAAISALLGAFRWMRGE